MDRPMLTDATKNLSAFAGGEVISPDADRVLADGDILQIGEESLKVLHVPGHTQGSLAFYQPGMLISGICCLRAAWAGRISRGSEEQLARSIREKVYCLPDETVIYPSRANHNSR